MPVKSTVEILQNFVAFLEYMNFNEEKLRQEVFMRFWNNILEWAACNFTIWLMLMDTKLFAKAARRRTTIQSTLQNNKGHPHLRLGHIPSEIAFNFHNKMLLLSYLLNPKLMYYPLIGGIQKLFSTNILVSRMSWNFLL